MRICRIAGSVHATVKDASLEGERILLAQPLSLDGEAEGAPLLAVDRADAGVGDHVLLMKEGGSARLILDDENSPVQCVVVAVVDHWAHEGKVFP
ncbi:MAG TPA: ethanolamine utilization protein EutN [Planctomycetes bacterium]|nr:ethanolamine utilization protein EutN [Planctomycetota bacterium]